MTAPLTPPPPDRSSQNAGGDRPPSPGDSPSAGAGPYGAGPGTAYADGGYGAGQGPQYGQDGPGMKTELREAAVVTVVVAVAGALLGLLWWWLAPHVPLVGQENGGGWVVYVKDTEGEQAVGADGTFTLLALAFGAVTAAGAFAWRRRGGVPLVVALGVGGLLGAVLAWRLGMWLGPAQDVLAHAKAVGKGVTFPAPLELGAKGALLAWPLAALLVHLGLTAMFGPRDPEPPYLPQRP
ncbi:AAA family ATPase [Streptomyces sp. MS06]|uniref:AAA family ATPase n=1 Tax=Streptomyces sp. MS06 TaxID=3385974 RepID=UPI0039A374BF